MSYQRSIDSEIKVPGFSIGIVRHIFSTEGQHTSRRDDYVLSKSLYPSSDSVSDRVSTLVEGCERNFRIGSAVLQPADRTLYVPNFSPGIYPRIEFNISKERFESITGMGDRWTLGELASCLNITDPLVNDCMSCLGREMLAPGFASKDYLQSICTFLVIHIGRTLRKQVGARVPTDDRSLAPWQLKRINEELSCLNGHVPKVEDLARACGISTGHLGRLFKRSTGRLLHAHIEQIRLDQAKTLMVSSALSLKEISWIVGYANTSSFSVAFRRRNGETPGRFRRQFKSYN
jgi:AraC family transcriptional regulator